MGLASFWCRQVAADFETRLFRLMFTLATFIWNLVAPTQVLLKIFMMAVYKSLTVKSVIRLRPGIEFFQIIYKS